MLLLRLGGNSKADMKFNTAQGWGGETEHCSLCSFLRLMITNSVGQRGKECLHVACSRSKSKEEGREEKIALSANIRQKLSGLEKGKEKPELTGR